MVSDQVKEFEAGSAGQDRRGDDPDRDTPRSRGRHTDDGDDRIFRQATDDEQGRGARPDRGGSDSGFGPGHLDFISMAMNMARPHTDDLEAMPGRSPRSPFPGESQALELRTGCKDQGPWWMLEKEESLSYRNARSREAARARWCCEGHSRGLRRLPLEIEVLRILPSARPAGALA